MGRDSIRTELAYAVGLIDGEASKVLAVFLAAKPAHEYADRWRAWRDENGQEFGIAVIELVDPAVAVIEWTS